LDDLPLRIEEIARVGGAKFLVGEASCWRGFVLITGGAGAPRRGGNQAAVPLAWRDQWRAANPSQTSSPRQKTPLVLPRKLSGERRKGQGFAQPPEKSSLPCRERQRGSCSQAAVGHPLETDREGLATPGFGDSPIGCPILAVRENILLRPVSPHNPSGKQEHRKVKPDADR